MMHAARISQYDLGYYRGVSIDSSSEERHSIAGYVRDAAFDQREAMFESAATVGHDISERIVRFVDPGTDEEYESLLKEQASLARQRVMVGLTRREELQLTMVRWAIDRVENARAKADLDQYGQITALHERLAEEIQRLVSVAR